jgi:lipoate---protein ligase
VTVKLLELTLPSPEQNIALDEALLDEAEAAGSATEVLRLWEPATPLVVIGRSSRLAEEVNVDQCQARGIPILRRSSGGAAIVTGPGCLMYAVVLSYELRPELHSLDRAHEFVLGTLLTGLRQLAPKAERRGTSDLAIGGRKFSGNSLRCKRTHLMYHGTLLYNFELKLISNVLRTAPRQPHYRAGRSHNEFVANVPIGQAELRDCVVGAWHCTGALANWPSENTARLAAAKYTRRDWTYQF